MGLKIIKPIIIYDEVSIPEFYFRINLRLPDSWDKIYAELAPYISKNSYKANDQNRIKFDSINPTIYEFSYDRAVDGVDILQLVHDKVKEKLSTDMTEWVDTYDSEGILIVDELGEPVKQEKILVPKLTEEANIIIDI